MSKSISLWNRVKQWIFFSDEPGKITMCNIFLTMHHCGLQNSILQRVWDRRQFFSKLKHLLQRALRMIQIKQVNDTWSMKCAQWSLKYNKGILYNIVFRKNQNKKNSSIYKKQTKTVVLIVKMIASFSIPTYV